MACLIRTDFNFPFAFFCYYLWISRDDKANSLMVTLSFNILAYGVEWNSDFSRFDMAFVSWIDLDSK